MLFVVADVNQVQFVEEFNELRFELFVIVSLENLVYAVTPVGMLCASLCFLKLGALEFCGWDPVNSEVLLY